LDFLDFLGDFLGGDKFFNNLGSLSTALTPSVSSVTLCEKDWLTSGLHGDSGPAKPVRLLG